MSVHEAEPGDVYVDGQGELWKIVGICREPTVIADRLTTAFEREGGAGIGQQRQSGGVSGLMWNGFRKLSERAP
jgi:hypothetical protein